MNWIRVKERLPKESEDVIATDGKSIYIARCWDDIEITWVDGYYGILGDITHWMPLPKPPEE